MLVAQSGLGVMLFNARSFFRIDYIVVGMIVAGVLWLATDKLVLQRVEARTIERWGILRRA
jgi:NitT/TauT family transport system permease protein/taurine transport system permease protein